MSVQKSLVGKKRGFGSCSSCQKEYHNRKKPKVCDCGQYLGGSFTAGDTKRSAHPPISASVNVYFDGALGNLRSVRTTPNDDRTFVFCKGVNRICFAKKCLDIRSAPNVPPGTFLCKHIDEMASDPIYSVKFSNKQIETFTPDTLIREDLKTFQSIDEIVPTVVKVSWKSYAVIGPTSTSASMKFVHVMLQPLKNQNEKFFLKCMAFSCKENKGRTKQCQRKNICVHLHYVLLARSLYEADAEVSVSQDSPEDVAGPSGLSLKPTELTNPNKSLSEPTYKTLQIQQKRSIPYTIPKDILRKNENILLVENQRLCFFPDETECLSCGEALGEPVFPQGCTASNGNAYLLTHLHPFLKIDLKVKRCKAKACNALNVLFPYRQGLFNACNKVLVGLDILLEWRELFKSGMPISNVIKRKLLALRYKLDEAHQPSDAEITYLTDILYNGFYGFEVMTERNLNDVICGYCGIIGKVYFGDGNEKNCCSMRDILLDEKISENVSMAEKSSNTANQLEACMEKIKLHLLEKCTYAKPKLKFSVHIDEIPPLIPSVQRHMELNTEKLKKSIYLQESNKKIEGDAMILSKQLRLKRLSIQEIPSMELKQITELAKTCKIPATGKSKDFLVMKLQQLYGTILVGTSSCHEFVKSPGHTGGFYHFVCSHGTTVCSKFMVLQESVRDAADLYLSLKYPPVLFVCDTPCTFVQHINHRDTQSASAFWGEFDGCFEEPDVNKEPSQSVDVPAIVPTTYETNKEKVEVLKDKYAHPLTKEKRRFVCGDRFHNKKNPHKSPLCRFHNIDLCAQGNTIRTSYQESINNKKNKNRNRLSCVQGILHHIFFNYLMNYYENEEIVQKQRKDLEAYSGKTVMRDNFMRFIF